MNKKHIDDVQKATVDEHFQLLLEDNTTLGTEIKHVTPDDLPDWYDEKLYKIGQNVYKRNIYSIRTGSVVGLISILSIASITKVLVYIKQSSTLCTAFKRYLETIVHIDNLYSGNLNNSKSRWYRSINVINWKHKTSNKRLKNDGIEKISQRDMVITQTSFIAYILTEKESIGLRMKPEEEEAFNHLWRVNSYMLGIPNRLNICRKTAKETRELCQKIISNIFVKNLKEYSSEFYHLASVAIDALWYYDVSSNKDAIIALTYRLNGIEYERPLGWYSWLNLKFHELIFYLFLKPYIGEVLRICCNCVLIHMTWLAVKWNLFAWISFGRKNCRINLYSVYK